MQNHHGALVQGNVCQTPRLPHPIVHGMMMIMMTMIIMIMIMIMIMISDVITATPHCPRRHDDDHDEHDHHDHHDLDHDYDMRSHNRHTSFPFPGQQRVVNIHNFCFIATTLRFFIASRKIFIAAAGGADNNILHTRKYKRLDFLETIVKTFPRIVTLSCHITTTVMDSGSQLSEMFLSFSSRSFC